LTEQKLSSSIPWPIDQSNAIFGYFRRCVSYLCCKLWTDCPFGVQNVLLRSVTVTFCALFFSSSLGIRTESASQDWHSCFGQHLFPREDNENSL